MRARHDDPDEMKDGKIHTAREYFDPFEVLDYVAQLTPPS